MDMTTEKAISAWLLEINAVKLSPAAPFTWASGWKSPIYCDNRKVLSHPVARDLVKSELCSVIFDRFPDADALSGVATAGIAWGAMAADQLKLPYSYVRPKPKEHGLGNQLEGEIKPGSRVVVIEDLVSTGKSSLEVVKVLKGLGADVVGMVAIFSYGFPEATEAFETAGIPLYTLSDYNNLVEVATARNLVGPDHLHALLKWRKDPAHWTGID